MAIKRMTPKEDTKIDIPSYEALLDVDNEVKLQLNRCCNDVGDLRAIIKTIEESARIVKETIGTNIDVSFLNDTLDSIIDLLGQKCLRVFGALPQFEDAVLAIDTGGEYDIGVFEGIDLNWNDFASWGNDFISTVFSGEWEAAGLIVNLCLNFATGKPNEEEVNIVNNTASVSSYIWDRVAEVIAGKYGLSNFKTALLNGSVGSIISLGLTAIVERLTDEGDFTDKDFQRMLWKSTSAFASTFVSTVALSMIAGAVEGGKIGSAGGAITAVAGILAGAVVGWGIDTIGAYRVGDNEIDSFIVVLDANGNEIILENTPEIVAELERRKIENIKYSVPQNGNGKYGTWDVIYERQREINRIINRHPEQTRKDEHGNYQSLYMSSTNKKMLMYNDWDSYLRYSKGSEYMIPYTNTESQKQAAINDFNSILEEALQCESSEEAHTYFYNRIYNNPKIQPATQNLYKMLVTDGFSIKEYYDYHVETIIEASIIQ